MKNFKVKIVTGGILFITIIFVCWIHHPLPPYQGELPLSGLKSPVDVFTDEFGVPHVFAKNEDDLFFTAGYLSGRERLFQLSTVALAVRGELSSALGDQYLGSDIYLRTWRIHDIAKKMVESMEPKNKRIFESFCNGINYRIDEIKKRRTN